MNYLKDLMLDLNRVQNLILHEEYNGASYSIGRIQGQLGLMIEGFEEEEEEENPYENDCDSDCDEDDHIRKKTLRHVMDLIKGMAAS